MSRRLAILTAQLQNRPLWETVPGNPLVQRNRDTGMLRAMGLTEISINTNGPISDRTGRMPLPNNRQTQNVSLPSYITDEWAYITPNEARALTHLPKTQRDMLALECSRVERNTWYSSGGLELGASCIADNLLYRVRGFLDIPF